MFASLSRSWEFAKMSYRLLFEHKRLILFPLISTLASVAVMASFLIPLWNSGLLAEWSQFMNEEAAVQADPWMYVTAFVFYFCSYFTIIFFNSALVASVLRIVAGEKASISYGLSFALKRLPQIFGWALISAVVGVILRVVERAHRKLGSLIASLLGSAWTALTYFVVPVVVTDGVGPVEAFRRSTRTLKETWGTALVGSFSMGIFAFLLMIPVIVAVFALAHFGMDLSGRGIIAVGATVVLLGLIVSAMTTAADAIFKVFLYTYATGRVLPESVDTYRFAEAFRPKD